MATINKIAHNQIYGNSKFRIIPGSVWSDLKTVKKGKRASGDVWMENAEIEKIREFGGIFINDVFIDIWNNDAQILLLEGSYGSSKTTYAITRLLVHCMEDKFFKCFYGRQEKEMARQLHSNIVREIERNHWEHLFEYSKKPNGSKNIFCNLNGNCFELFGCDDEDTLKGIDNPTHILVDEVNQIDFNAFGMLITRLRTSGAKLQFIGCFNPCDVLPSHWIVKYMYAGGKTASGFVNIEKNAALSDEEAAILDALEDLNVLSHHSTYLDNYFQNPDSYYKKLVIKAGGDPERVKDYAMGRWGAQLNAQPYYKNFKFQRDTFAYDTNLIIGKDEAGLPVDDTGRHVLAYDKYAPLLFSFDENIQPYLPAIIAQRHGDELWIIDEIAAENPLNNIWDVTDMVKERYPLHNAGMKIYGDATAKKDSTILEEGQNFFTMIGGLLAKYSPDLCVPDSNPNNKTRGLFINIVFKLCYGGLVIKISRKCKKLIEDLENCMEAMDPQGASTGRKDKTTKMINGNRNVQPYGHLGDCMDYMICGEFMDIYTLFQNNGVTYDPVGGGRSVRNSIDNFDIAPENRPNRPTTSGGQFDSYQKYKKSDKSTIAEKIEKLKSYVNKLENKEEFAYNEVIDFNNYTEDEILEMYKEMENRIQGNKNLTNRTAYGVGENYGMGSRDSYDEDFYTPQIQRHSRNKMR
jgi:hypothetical protein